MASIFPFTNPSRYITTTTEEKELPLYRDVEWDFLNNKPVFLRGEPKIVNGLPAVMSWAWRALYTERFLNEIYSWNYGNEMMGVVGEPWDKDVKTAELSRYCFECLFSSPYITNVYNINVSFFGSRVTMSCNVNTIYGSDRLEVVV